MEDLFRIESKQQILVIALFTVVGLLLTACGTTQLKTVTIGVINLDHHYDTTLEGFKVGMNELGYVEGENITYIYQGPAGSLDEIEPLVQNLIEADVDLILSLDPSTPQIVQQVAVDADVPVIAVPLSEPVRAGIVESLSQPGGNITGITIGVENGRRLEWLSTVDPSVELIYILHNPVDRSPFRALPKVSEAGLKLDIEFRLREVYNDDEVTAALGSIPPDVDAIFILPDPFVTSRMDDFVKAALEHNLPLSVPTREHVKEGALIAYGFDFFAVGKQAARLADQILRGTKPANLPVETAEFFLTINLQTAEAIGLEIPDEILRMAHTIVR